MTIMRAKHRFWYEIHGSSAIEATDTEVRVTHRNLHGTMESVYPYSELQSRITRGRSGEYGWKKPAGFFLFFALIAYFVGNSTLNYTLAACSAVVSVVCYLATYIKYDWLAFYDRSGENAFALYLPQDEAIAEFIARRTADAHAHSHRTQRSDAT
jgi:hypothetical protein